MAWTTSQVGSNHAVTTSVAVALGGAINAGDLIACWCHCNTGDPTATPVSDNVFGIWPNDGIAGKNTELLTSGMGGVSSGRLYLAWIIAPSGAPSGITITVSGNAGASRTYAIARVLRPPSGTVAKRASIATDGGAGAGTTATTGNASPNAQAGDVLIGGFVQALGDTSAGWAAVSPLTSGIIEFASNGYLFEGYDLNAVGGEHLASATFTNSQQWLAAFASFMATISGPVLNTTAVTAAATGG